MLDIVAIVLLAIVVVLLIAVLTIVLLRRTGKAKSEESVEFTPEQEEYITDQLAGVVTLVKENTAIHTENMQNNIIRSITQSSTQQTEWQKASQQGIEQRLDNYNTAQVQSFNNLENKLTGSITDIRKELKDELNTQRDQTAKDSREMRDLIDSKVQRMQNEVRENLNEIRADNEKRLNEIRKTVDDQLQDTLNTRINESFKLISERLDAVNKGLGEMANLNNGVNALNKVLSNVKTRGIWGEVSLDNLLSQLFTPEQYASQYHLPRRKEAVDFVIFLPGKGEERVVLPIDAKFPMTDYAMLVEASETLDTAKIAEARKALLKRIIEEAKSISEKYISIPKTTNFAIMYLPVEGLFAEVVRGDGIIEKLQSDYRIVVAGPTTLTALLNSLQMGFKTLQIQKNSQEVVKALHSFTKYFDKFRSNLDAMQRQVGTVSKTIETSIKNTEQIGKTLDKVNSISLGEPEVDMLGGAVHDED